ncbi:MAG: ribosomal-processing cysteine protease Prp [Treponema sp.]|nr:ribosomal-processing cysteine protease Prp [Candidatus Treponema caballi]
MVRAKFRIDPKERKLSMRIAGHAGAGPKGFDVVCAGASMYAFGISQCFKNMEEEGKLENPAMIAISNGRVSASVTVKPEYFGEAVHTLYVAQVGFRLLSEAYPDYAKLIPYETSLTGDSE